MASGHIGTLPAPAGDALVTSVGADPNGLLKLAPKTAEEGVSAGCTRADARRPPPPAFAPPRAIGSRGCVLLSGAMRFADAQGDCEHPLSWTRVFDLIAGSGRRASFAPVCLPLRPLRVATSKSPAVAQNRDAAFAWARR